MLVQSFNIRERTLHFAPGLTRKDFDDLNAPGKSARELTETVAKVITADEKPAPKTKRSVRRQLLRPCVFLTRQSDKAAYWQSEFLSGYAAIFDATHRIAIIEGNDVE